MPLIFCSSVYTRFDIIRETTTDLTYWVKNDLTIIVLLLIVVLGYLGYLRLVFENVSVIFSYDTI